MATASRRHYTSTAQPTTLNGTIDGVANAISVASMPGVWPAAPFEAALERGTVNEEAVLVTAVTGAGPFAWTVTRGYGGTQQVAHNSGVPVEHTVTGVDYDEANAHASNASASAAHGPVLAGDLDPTILSLLAASEHPLFPGAVPTLFLNGTPSADGTTHPYVVPAGKVAIFRKVQVVPSATVTGLTLYLADGAGTGWGGVILNNETLAQGQEIDLDGWYVAPAGSVITVSTASGAASCWIVASGLLMNTPAGFPAPIIICNQYTASGDNTLYTVPAGRTLIVLTAVATEIGGVATTASLRIGAAPAMIPWTGPIGPSKAIQDDGFWVAPAGTQILANAGGDAGSHVVFSLSGVLL